MRTEDRTAPIQPSDRGRVRIPGGRIPWALHELAWRAYAAAGHGDQSAERIAERHGFDWVELVALLRGEYLKEEGIKRAGAELFEGIEGADE
ncbi:hypothetical protein LCGC14_0841460 [marine sediment metagenome]|uniref:Uncharacterized protein n=1 Tax=marine sediment metagenome TaxID=412755 RepID=A0A0F9PHP4_9ZZZZ